MGMNEPSILPPMYKYLFDVAEDKTIEGTERDRKEIAKAIRDIQSCLNSALKDARLLGIEVEIGACGSSFSIEMEYQPPTPDVKTY